MKLDEGKLLTDKQAKAVKSIKKRCKAQGLGMPTTDIVTAAHAEVYDISADDPRKVRHIASTIAGQNLAKPEFRAALGFESEELKTYVGEEILRNLRGENPLFGKNAEIYRDSLKLAARMTFPEKQKVIYESDERFKDKSEEDLQFYVEHGHWPNQDPMEGFGECSCRKPKGGDVQ